MSQDDKSSIEKNFSQSNDTQFVKSNTKRKAIRQIKSDQSDNEILAQDSEANYPQSFQKPRYAQLNQEIILENMITDDEFPHPKRKDKAYRQTESQASSQNVSSTKANKKLSETVFSPYDFSYDERISIQTTDSKQFSGSFDFEDKELADVIRSINSGNAASRKTFVEKKDYFDCHIVEDVCQECEDSDKQEKCKNQDFHSNENVQPNCFEQKNQIKAQSKEQIYPRMEIQQSSSNSNSFKLQNFQRRSNKDEPLSEFELQNYLVAKQNQLRELTEAYNQTENQNDLLRNRIAELQRLFKHAIKHKVQQTEINQNTKRKFKMFQKSVEFLRKYSL